MCDGLKGECFREMESKTSAETGKEIRYFVQGHKNTWMHSSARMQCDNIRAGRKRGVKWERFLNPKKIQVKYWFQTWKQFLVRMNGWYWVLSRKETTSLEFMKSLRNIFSILLRTLFMWFVNPKSPVHVHWEAEKGSLQGVKRELTGL